MVEDQWQGNLALGSVDGILRMGFDQINGKHYGISSRYCTLQIECYPPVK